jgi:hypothetical protein
MIGAALEENEDRLPPGVYKVEVVRHTSSSMTIEVQVTQEMTADQVKDLAEDQAATEDFPSPNVSYYEIETIKGMGGEVIVQFM